MPTPNCRPGLILKRRDSKYLNYKFTNCVQLYHYRHKLFINKLDF